MPPLPDFRQELFVRECVKNRLRQSNQTDAWLVSHPNVKSRAVAQAAAARAIKYPKVQARYQELMAHFMKKSDISIEKILSDYQLALDMAKQQEKPSEIIAAAREQARLIGLLRERVETGNVGDFDNMTDVGEILRVVEREAGPQAAMALVKAFNLEPVQEAEEDTSALEQSEPASDAIN
jgi:hypothetical protein